MSENMIAFGMAAKLSDDALPKDPADREEITEAWAENALHTNYAGDFVYVYVFSEDITMAFHHHNMNVHQADAEGSLDRAIKECNASVTGEKIFFVDLWYNGVDASIDMATWEKLKEL